MSLLPGTLLAAGLAGLVAASVTDIRERLIHNEVVLFVLAVGIALRLISTPELLWLSLAGAALLLLVLGLFARFDIIGGGDAKLIAVSMLLLPPQHDAQLIANIAIAGGFLSCLYLTARIVQRRKAPVQPCGDRENSRGFFRDEFTKVRAGEPMPYALAILGGVTYSIVTEAIPCIYATSCLL